MDHERTACAGCTASIPVESLLCYRCGAAQPGSDIPEGGPLARDWVIAGLILVIVAITALVLIDLQMGHGLTRSGGDTCESAEGVPCEP